MVKKVKKAKVQIQAEAGSSDSEPEVKPVGKSMTFSAPLNDDEESKQSFSDD
jgi:hypothetical protein